MYQARKADVKLLKITLEIVLLKKNWCDKHTLNKQLACAFHRFPS